MNEYLTVGTLVAVIVAQAAVLVAQARAAKQERDELLGRLFAKNEAEYQAFRQQSTRLENPTPAIPAPVIPNLSPEEELIGRDLSR